MRCACIRQLGFLVRPCKGTRINCINNYPWLLQLELSWFGSDEESGIHTYEVGLSSTGSEDVDLLPYTSTHGHRHFITYHPNLMDGETFYVHIKAVNRAGQQTVEVTINLNYIYSEH